MAACLSLDMFNRLFLGPGLPVGPLVRQSIVNIHHGEYPRGQWDLFSFQAERVAGAIPFLVVTKGDIQSLSLEHNRFK